MQLTIKILNATGDWVTAICPELEVSGMGYTIKDALEAVERSIRSTLKANEYWKARGYKNKGKGEK